MMTFRSNRSILGAADSWSADKFLSLLACQKGETRKREGRGRKGKGGRFGKPSPDEEKARVIAEAA